MLHGGVDPGLLDEVQWWRSDDLWYWSLEALAAYIRAATDRIAEPSTRCAGGSPTNTAPRPGTRAERGATHHLIAHDAAGATT
jgi:hypothetical protein